MYIEKYLYIDYAHALMLVNVQKQAFCFAGTSCLTEGFSWDIFVKTNATFSIDIQDIYYTYMRVINVLMER